MPLQRSAKSGITRKNTTTELPSKLPTKTSGTLSIKALTPTNISEKDVKKPSKRNDMKNEGMRARRASLETLFIAKPDPIQTPIIPRINNVTETITGETSILFPYSIRNNLVFLIKSDSKACQKRPEKWRPVGYAIKLWRIIRPRTGYIHQSNFYNSTKDNHSNKPHPFVFYRSDFMLDYLSKKYNAHKQQWHSSH